MSSYKAVSLKLLSRTGVVSTICQALACEMFVSAYRVRVKNCADQLSECISFSSNFQIIQHFTDLAKMPDLRFML